MLRKNLPASRLWWVMLIRFFMDYAAALQMLLTGQVSNAKAVFQARWAYHKIKKQYPISNSGKQAAIKLLTRRSIVFDFYLCKKKK